MTCVLRGAAAALAVLAAAPAQGAKRPLPPGERIDLNHATVAELMRLPGVGEKRAQAIVALRQRRPFRRPEDVVRVKGLGRSWLQRVRSNLGVGAAPAPVAAATARR